MQLANIAPYVNKVILSFIQPDASYKKGSYNFTGTGLQFAVDGKVVKNAIFFLKTRKRNTKVLVAVGGQTYTNFVAPSPNKLLEIIKLCMLN